MGWSGLGWILLDVSFLPGKYASTCGVGVLPRLECCTPIMSSPRPAGTACRLAGTAGTSQNQDPNFLPGKHTTLKRDLRGFEGIFLISEKGF